MANSPEEIPPFQGEQDNLASPTQDVGTPHVGPQRELKDLPVRVLNTISEARALSTRCLYALK